MQTTRRAFLATRALAAIGLAAQPKSALGSISVAPPDTVPMRDTLITVFLRGGADGLSIVAPYGDDGYFRNRPTLALPRPGESGRSSLTNLDGFFGLHPALSALLPLYQSGEMAIVHACGSGDQTRSHFEAMATMERGLNRDTGPAGGWLARHLQSLPPDSASPLRAVALGEILPETLRGARNATVLRSVDELRLQVPFSGQEARFQHALAALYTPHGNKDILAEAGQETLRILKTLRGISQAGYRPRTGAAYPKDDLGGGLQQVACLMKAGVGLEAACMDHFGYDTHVIQGAAQGVLAARLSSLGQALAAFATDLGAARWAHTTVVVLSEFGRRVAENGGGGTDHGRGGVMLVLGGSIKGGRVYGRWPGLDAAQLDGPGDLAVTTDYRNVLAEIIATRMNNPKVDSIFPGLSYQPIGFTRGV